MSHFQDNSPYKSAPRYVLRSLIKEAAGSAST